MPPPPSAEDPRASSATTNQTRSIVLYSEPRYGATEPNTQEASVLTAAKGRQRAPATTEVQARPGKDRILQKQVELLYEHAPSGLMFTVVTGALLALVLWPVQSHARVGVWFGLLVVVTATRGALIRAFVTRRAERSLRAWWRLFDVGIVAQAALWAVSGTYLFPFGHYAHESVVTFVLAGMTAGGVAFVSFTRRTYQLYLVTAMAPCSVNFFLQGERQYVVFGVLVWLFVLGMHVSSRRIRESGAKLLELQFANLDLFEAVKTTESYITKHLQNTPVAVVDWHEGFVVRDWNRAAERIFGLPREEAVGRSARELFGFGEEGDAERLWAKVTSSPDGIMVRRDHRRHDGTPVICDWYFTPLSETDGRVVRVASMAQDVTARVAVDRMKDEFVSTVSHELRTPLTAIRGSLDLLVAGVVDPVSPQGQELIFVAKSNCARLDRLIGDLLDFEKLASGKLAVSKRAVRLDTLLEEALTLSRPYADRFSIKLTFRRDPEDLWADTDPDRMMQVLINLLSNAVKFSNPGDEVNVELGRHGGRARIAVRDRGTGIPESFRARIFQKFSQADGSDTRSAGGTGLGLCIAKSLVELLGGEISFDSVEGAGTTFYVALPLSTPPAIPRLGRGTSVAV